MKNLALALVLFCGLAALLAYVATNGIGARAPSFTTSMLTENRSQAIKVDKPGPPEIVVKAQPIAHPVAAIPKPRSSKVSALSKTPYEALSRKRIRRSTDALYEPAQPLERRMARAPRFIQTPTVVARTPKKTDIERRRLPVVVYMPKSPRVEPQRLSQVATRSRESHELNFVVRRESREQPASTVEKREIEANREWRKQMLDRWAKEEERKQLAREAAERSALNTDYGRDGSIRRSGNSVDQEMGYMAANEIKPKKKKKRRSFLGIRW
ncbi:MAG: hypothetical protein QOJ65_1649 [Fimbriimonadaceae bacterium]|jgi:hypothetical protein|nr:hypothetical protein [Fimbriimonadaceae bacterium]